MKSVTQFLKDRTRLIVPLIEASKDSKLTIKSGEVTRVCSLGFRSHFIELTHALLQSTKPKVRDLIEQEGGRNSDYLDEWKNYLASLEEDNEKLSATLGGVEISKASIRGVFDFNTEEIMDRYQTFLMANRRRPEPQRDSVQDFELCEDASSPTETRANDGVTGDPKADPREKVPDTDENGEGLGRNQKSLDQWLNQIINHPEAPGLREDQGDDKSFNTANFWKETPKVDKEVLDLIIQELGF